MPLSREERQEFDLLLSVFNGGGLDELQQEQLANLLKNHPDAIELYLDQCEADAMLRETYGLLNPVVAPAGVGGPRVASIWMMMLAATILLAVGMAAGSWWTRGRSERATMAFVKSDVDGRAKPLGVRVAKVIRNSGARLIQGSREDVFPTVGDHIRSSHYQLRGGVLELEYSSGARVIIESPAVVDLKSDQQLNLLSGRLSVRCPTPESQGFTVVTPSGMAVDLGTEFSVDVDQNGVRDDEYHVFSGEVVVKRNSGEMDEVPVKEGQALRMDRVAATPAGIDVDHQRFIRGFESDSDDYHDRIVALDPVVYYVMRAESDGQTLRSEMGEDFHAKIHSSNPNHLCYSPGFNGGTAFRLDGVGTYAVAREYPQSKTDRLSVMAWVYAQSRPSWASIAKNWGDGVAPELRGQFHFGLHKITGEFRGCLEAHVNDNDDVEQFAIDPDPIPLNRWHHVAMVADGSVLHLYRNGIEVAATNYNGLNGNPRIKALAIGTKLDERMKPAALNPLMKPISLSQGFWDGSIDHLAIFNDALDASQIEQLYQIGSASMKDRLGQE